MEDQVIDNFGDNSGVDTTNSADVGINVAGYASGLVVNDAIGGTITTDGSDKIHTFLNAGNGTATNDFVVPAGFPGACDFLVIAGGGGAGDGNYGRGGGGGAGGYRNSYNNETSGDNSASETGLTLTAGNTYPVTVGAGGAGFPDAPSKDRKSVV